MNRRVVQAFLLVGCMLLAGCGIGQANGTPHIGNVSALAPQGRTVRILQMNLCGSGAAPCYTAGRAVRMAAALIRERRPDIVTVDEVCRGDVAVLKTAMSVISAKPVAASFKPAFDRRTNGPYLCRNGDQYGIGVLAVIPDRSQSPTTHRTIGGLYPTQVGNDPEERVWTCIDAATAFTGCATHSASTSVTVAFAQCRYFLRSIAPMLLSTGDHDPVILGGDLNLLSRGPLGAQSCLPRGYQRAGDGALQDVITSPGTMVVSRTRIGMRRTTDHPALLVQVRLPS